MYNFIRPGFKKKVGYAICFLSNFTTLSLIAFYQKQSNKSNSKNLFFQNSIYDLTIERKQEKLVLRQFKLTLSNTGQTAQSDIFTFYTMSYCFSNKIVFKTNRKLNLRNFDYCLILGSHYLD